MIIYFSATGNCKWVAEQIADATDEKTYSIRESLDQKSRTLILKKGETLGFVTPTYFWQLPTVFSDWLSGTSFILEGGNYVFTLATFGTTTGAVSSQLASILLKKGVHIDTVFALRMTDTWTPIFDLSDPEKNLEILAQSRKDLDEIIEKIRAHAAGDFNRNQMPAFTRIPARYLYDKARKTKHFKVTDACVDCHLCKKQCPVKAIEMQGGKPVWTEETCTMCLGCLHRCPKNAIRYDDKTQKHGQYRNPFTRL